MQTVTVVCVGNLKEGYWKDAAAEYQKRLGAFCKLLVVEIEEERLPQEAVFGTDRRRNEGGGAADSV